MIHKEIFKIRTSECDKEMKLVPSAIMDLFQEAAGRHSALYNLDSPTLIKNSNSTWVLSGMAMEVERYPIWPETIEVETWAKSLKGFKAYRDYRICDKNGQAIVNGSSIWALLDVKKRRPLKIDEIGKDVQLYKQDSMEIIPGKLAKNDNEKFSVKEFRVNKGDIDMNDHVSNLQSLEWLYRESDPDFIKNHELESFNMIYKGEAKLGDIMVYKSSIINNNGLHIFINKETNREYLKINAKWRKV